MQLTVQAHCVQMTSFRSIIFPKIKAMDFFV